MFDFGWQEFLVVAFVLVLVVGPKDLPKVLRAFTKFTSQARRMSSEFSRSLQEMADDEDLKDVKKVLQDAKSGDFEEISEMFDDSVTKDIKSVGKELETDLKQVYDKTKDATSVKEG
ncbi:MAG: twin-arginine translocase subunit TatB [SAR116 cluster bacterium]|jgi:sec-independent protein translocase protein TatB|nr:twin-arginine translocase subunit TatB [SAR116 cluster bacterium]RCL77990.1 MAG: twin-arginine translocase subunit TatB [SAR116 cluster bacterium]CAI8307693.1 MAG: Sec-independent protein translocase protein TatB [SAR116 cluster bacterium]